MNWILWQFLYKKKLYIYLKTYIYEQHFFILRRIGRIGDDNHFDDIWPTRYAMVVVARRLFEK